MQRVSDVPEPFELGDALVDARGPAARQPRPVGAHRDMVAGQPRDLDANLLERQPDPLREHDEGDPPQHRPRIAAMARPGPFRPDQAAVLVEAERRCGDAAAPRDLADGQQILHAPA